jgi:hypothetical protein
MMEFTLGKTAKSLIEDNLELGLYSTGVRWFFKRAEKIKVVC